MKIVEQQMMDAVVKKHSVRLGTTYVVYEGGVSKVYFYGTQIAEVTDKTVKIRNCGHTTSTTKSRLNAILLTLVDDKWIYQKNNVWYLSGYRFDSAFLKGVEGEWIEFSNDFLLKSFVQQD